MLRLRLPDQRSIRLLFPVVITALLVACQSEGEKAPTGPATQSRPYEGDYEVVQPSTDSIGSYIIAASSRIEGDDGYEVKMVERYYPALNVSRFLVSQLGLEKRAATVGVEGIDLSITVNGDLIESTDLLNSPEIDVIENVYSTKLFTTEISAADATNRACAVLTIEYADGRHYPHALSTCDQRGLSSPMN